MLSESNQLDKENTALYLLYMKSKKYEKLLNITKKKQTYRYREQIVVTNWEREEGKGMIRIGN